ncbi:hypothetical protein EVAR_30927_1 [Eumeta japonica]|uniref:Mariner Mos1 transposase n=1 Tax=Eumeta variegata TaxID=151549 RepID=A0A4C1V4Y6_EUMVA|nr:hypothetical protein EVAR_30927_1 [Eumeta japonica]
MQCVSNIPRRATARAGGVSKTNERETITSVQVLTLKSGRIFLPNIRLIGQGARRIFAESSNLSNIEHRAVIKYFVKKGKRPKKFLKTWYQFFRNLRLRIRWSKNGLAYFNKDERAVKMILAQGVL